MVLGDVVLGAGFILATVPPLVTFAQVGAVRKGEGWRDGISCCVVLGAGWILAAVRGEIHYWVPACQLDRPTIREEEVGGQVGVVVGWLTCGEPSTPLAGEG
jgi:hypothetical protein